MLVGVSPTGAADDSDPPVKFARRQHFPAGCLAGPAAGVGPDGPCRCDDLNGDGFVDLRDAGDFLRRFGTSR